MLLTGFTGAVRFALRDVLLNLRSTQHKDCVLPSTELVKLLPSCAALRLTGNHKIVTFLDDNPAYWSRSIGGIDSTALVLRIWRTR